MSGLRPNIYTYGIMMDIFSKANLSTRVSELHEEMTSLYDIQPNGVTYTIVLNSYRKSGEIRKMLELFREMRKRGIEPNRYMYNIMIDVFGGKEEFERLEAFFQKMKEQLVMPDVVTYNTVIKAYARKGNRRRVMDLFHEMIGAKVTPNVRTFTSMMIAKPDPVPIADLLKKSQDAGFKPDEDFYFTVLTILGKRGESDVMRRIIELMKRQGSINIDQLMSVRNLYMNK